MYSILIVDDHEFARDTLRKVSQDLFENIQVMEAASLTEALQLIKQHHFALALVDISLPDGSGIDLVKAITATSPNTYVVIATIYDDDKNLFASLKAGAKGYLLKDQSDDDMRHLLQGILKGQPPLSPSIARRILAHFQETDDRHQRHDLTVRECEVLILIGKGYTRAEVAEVLNISVNTAAEHIQKIYHKLNINSRAEAALEACRLGLITPATNR